MSVKDENRMATTKIRMVRWVWAYWNAGEMRRSWWKRRRFQCFGHVKRRDETENVSSCRNEDGGEDPYRKTHVEMEGYGQERHESLEHQGGMGH